jgi:DNA-directed RNA polymerase subunit alpha
MPDKVVMEKADDFHGIFEFKPLEKGYGATIGNSLRRILLSSLEGYAITAIKIPGVLHEFSTVPGIVEDVCEMILNLKMIRFARLGESTASRIQINISGQDTFTGADINRFTNVFQVLNPKQVICHLDPSVSLEIELLIDKGRGYVPAEDNKVGHDQLSGIIAVDSIFTPIKNVKYAVDNFRVEGRTDYERLVLDITTDGSIHPEDALKGAANILIKPFMLFSDQNITYEITKVQEEETVDEEFLRMRKLLKTNLADLDLSVRAYNCLKAADVRTLGDLARLEVSDMMKFRNFGKKSLTELENLMAEKSLVFGMDVTKYKLDEE